MRPGPDIPLIVSQALTAGQPGALRTNAGILLGDTAHPEPPLSVVFMATRGCAAWAKARPAGC